MRPPETFETARLIARPPRTEDAASAFAAYANDPLVTRYLAWKPHLEVGTVAEFFGVCAEQWAPSSGGPGHYPWLLFLRGTGTLIGSIGIELEDNRAGFGYVLGRAQWGNGFAAEAMLPLVDWALAQASIFRAWAFCDVENPGSARVMEKAGMTREGLLRRWHVCPTIGIDPRDCYVYAKVR
jgi:[ribosomal protein S5]-alanine N-acetyltransferase